MHLKVFNNFCYSESDQKGDITVEKKMEAALPESKISSNTSENLDKDTNDMQSGDQDVVENQCEITPKQPAETLAKESETTDTVDLGVKDCKNQQKAVASNSEKEQLVEKMDVDTNPSEGGDTKQDSNQNDGETCATENKRQNLITEVKINEQGAGDVEMSEIKPDKGDCEKLQSNTDDSTDQDAIRRPSWEIYDDLPDQSKLESHGYHFNQGKYSSLMYIFSLI